jgi:hypothetical protein
MCMSPDPEPLHAPRNLKQTDKLVRPYRKAKALKPHKWFFEFSVSLMVYIFAWYYKILNGLIRPFEVYETSIQFKA